MRSATLLSAVLASLALASALPTVHEARDVGAAGLTGNSGTVDGGSVVNNGVNVANGDGAGNYIFPLLFIFRIVADRASSPP